MNVSSVNILENKKYLFTNELILDGGNELNIEMIVFCNLEDVLIEVEKYKNISRDMMIVRGVNP